MSWASGPCWPPLADTRQGLITQWLALNPALARRGDQVRLILGRESYEDLSILVQHAWQLVTDTGGGLTVAQVREAGYQAWNDHHNPSDGPGRATVTARPGSQPASANPQKRRTPPW